MSRIKVLSYDQMTSDQQALHDEILSGPRSRIAGPMNAWFRSPELGSLSQKLGAFCRYHTSLAPQLSELAILVVARHWVQSIEWTAHKPIALDAGLDPSIADAIERGETPEFENEDEEIVYVVADEICGTRQLSEATFDRALTMFDEKTFFELTAVIGYYTNIAIQLNCFAVAAPGADELFKS